MQGEIRIHQFVGEVAGVDLKWLQNSCRKAVIHRSHSSSNNVSKLWIHFKYSVFFIIFN